MSKSGLVTLCLTITFNLLMKHSIAQTASRVPTFSFVNGVGIVHPDSLYSLNFRFRTQLRSAYNTTSPTDLSPYEIETGVRRLRLRFEGFAVSTKLNYYVQLSFSRSDMDWIDNDNSLINSSPNVVRDAVITYRPSSNFSIIFGQTKLPGNRQRVVSSGELQFADRSIVNGTFNIDRDFGLQLWYESNKPVFNYAIKGAVSSGEGRNATRSDNGLAYTGRVELLPLGKFVNKGDYFEGDLEREQTPKLAIAGGYHYNVNAVRSAGTLGRDLFERRDLRVLMVDALLKYNGWAITAEYASRSTNDPITVNDLSQQRVIYVGSGRMMQISYLFENNVEIAGRYALTTPYASVQTSEFQRKETGLGMTKYLRRHRVKLQGQLFYISNTKLLPTTVEDHYINALFQIELGI